jgi:hypothetical protein
MGGGYHLFMTIFGAISITFKTALLFCSSTVFATTLVAVTTATEAYLGADSRGQGTNEPICKVIEAHGVAVGMSGVLADAATQFNAANHITAALRRSTDLKSTIENVIADLEGPLARSIAWAKVNAPAEYAKYDGKKVLELLFVTVVNGEPRIGVLVWRAQNGQILHEGPTYLGTMQSLVVGTHDAVKAYQESHPNWVNLPATEIIETFLRIEAKQEATFVGPPFSIVRIDTSGAHWVCPGVCESPTSNK